MNKTDHAVDVIAISDIYIPKDRFRKDPGDMQELIASIREEGLITPITVKKNKLLYEYKEGDYLYTLLAGYRRLEALKVLGHKQVPARVYPENLPALSSRVIELDENLRRKGFEWREEVMLKAEIHRLQLEMHPDNQTIVEEVDGKRIGYVEKGWSIEDTAKLLDESRHNTSKDIRLAEAMEVMPDLAKYKTKDDAWKALQGLGKLHRADIQASALKKKHAYDHPDDVHKMLVDCYITGDFLKIALPTNRFDFINFDPPYGIDLHKVKREKGVNILKDAYNEVDASEYEEFMRKMLTKCYEISAINSWIVVWYSPEPIEYAYMILSIMKEIGYEGRAIPGVWKKDKGQTNRPELYLGNSAEFFLYARKGNAIINKQGRDSIFDYKPVAPQRKRHTTEKPIEMMEDLINTFIEPGKKAFSPCLGSGNDILAAVNIGVYMQGTELTKEFKDLYTVEVYKGRPPNYKSYKE
uniref:ParB-like N-terminal domain-containing protein n=1 Tax=viral metagenome TaxID=1070528 RepID=A0A6M3IZ65_9ZZZZ